MNRGSFIASLDWARLGATVHILSTHGHRKAGMAGEAHQVSIAPSFIAQNSRKPLSNKQTIAR